MTASHVRCYLELIISTAFFQMEKLDGGCVMSKGVDFEDWDLIETGRELYVAYFR